MSDKPTPEENGSASGSDPDGEQSEQSHHHSGPSEQTISPRRRRVLEALAAAGTVGLAGCSDGGDGGSDGGDGDDGSDGSDGGSSDGGSDGSDGGDGSDGDDGSDGEDSPDLWPQDRYDAGQTGYGSQATGPTTTSLTKAWEFKDGETAGNFRPVVGDGVVAQATGLIGDTEEGGMLYLFDEASGDKNWEVELANEPTEIALVEGTVYIGDQGAVAAYDAASGDELWSTSDARGRVVVQDDTVYTRTSADGTLAAVNASDGSTKWESDLFGKTTAGDGTVYQTLSDGTIKALSASDGSEQWEATVSTDEYGELTNSPAPTLADGTLYVPTPSGTLLTYDAGSGSENWTTEVFDGAGDSLNSLGAPVVGDGTVYVGGDQNVYALSASDGSQQWSYEMDTIAAYGKELVSDGETVYAKTAGDLEFIDASDGSGLGIFENSAVSIDSAMNPPSLANGAIYAGFNNTILTKLVPE